MKIKRSYGIALCRINKEFEILLIKKKYTYYFFEFVYGNYKESNEKYLMFLFNNMTYEEKMCILNMKFSDMWYRITLTNPDKLDYYGSGTIKQGKIIVETKIKKSGLNIYYKKKSKFEKNFLQDSGKRLITLINNSKNSDTPWEIPKGHKMSSERDLNAAKREFEEETNVNTDLYTILWNVKPIVNSYTSNATIYIQTYYIAYTTSDYTPKLSFKNYNQLGEIDSIKWVTEREIEFLKLNIAYQNRLKYLYRNIKKNLLKELKVLHV